MKYESSIFTCLEYIEKNIKEDLTAKDISYKVGYSEFHFSRIFKAQMGVSLMEYVKERKLICASKEIFSGKKIIDVSEEYGYKTHSGFSKAFKNKFGFTPTQHLIYAINMIDYLNKEIGDGDNMSKDLNKANVFIKPTIDFTDQEVLYKQLIISLKDRYFYDDLKIIEKAYKLACKAHEGQHRKSGEPYIIHPLCVAIILSETDADKESIIAGLLHDVILADTPCILNEIELEFSREVATLVEEVTRFNLNDLN
jgi:AraC-like DNA-binding protein